MPQQLLQSRETNVPEPLVAAEPLIGFGERLRIDAAVVCASAHGSLHEPGSLERLNVLRRRRQRHLVGLGKLANCVLARRQPLEHTAPSGVSERTEDKVELR